MFIYIVIVICVEKSSAEKISAAGRGISCAAVEVFIKVRLSPEFGKGGKRGPKPKKGGSLGPQFPSPFRIRNFRFHPGKRRAKRKSFLLNNFK
jgi:hypothetical protein